MIFIALFLCVDKVSAQEYFTTKLNLSFGTVRVMSENNQMSR